MPLTSTHRGGGTLDLVVTKSDQVLEEMTIYPPSIISDHSIISWRCPLLTQLKIVMNREVRGWTKLDRDSFRSALLESELYSSEQRPVTADEYFDLYHRVLTRLADQYAPVKRVTLGRHQLALWMDEECRQLRRKSRMLELLEIEQHRRPPHVGSKKTGTSQGVPKEGERLLVDTSLWRC